MSDHGPTMSDPQSGESSHVPPIESKATNDDNSFRLETPTALKQRRRRTSPRDHAILESAYQKNSKPDKEERQKLVEQTNLGEKEVQIWFQNRRQNDRRKSKPLQPHELIPHFRNGVPEEATKQLPSPYNSQERPHREEPTSSMQSQTQSSPKSSDIKSILNPADAHPPSSPTASLQQTPNIRQSILTPPSSLERSAAKSDASRPREGTSTFGADKDGQVTKKRSHEQMNEGTAGEDAGEDSPKEAKSLRRTSSFVRLAVSADGSVKVRVNDETTPSPPKERPPPPPNMANRRASGLTRAQSDVSSTFQFRDVSAMKGPPGRSRDARTWEFYCDRSARSSLAACAEQEATGSAVGAIGLVRSASHRTMQPLATNNTRQHNLRRRQSGLRAKPSLVRTQSSMARLQSSDGLDAEHDMKKHYSHRRQSSGSDSDKENWLPGTRESTHGLRRTEPTAARGTILQQPSSRAEPHSHAPPVLPSANDQENRVPASNGKEKAKGDDLDCVQGLLSLSQGAWR